MLLGVYISYVAYRSIGVLFGIFRDESGSVGVIRIMRGVYVG